MVFKCTGSSFPSNEKQIIAFLLVLFDRKDYGYDALIPHLKANYNKFLVSRFFLFLNLRTGNQSCLNFIQKKKTHFKTVLNRNCKLICISFKTVYFYCIPNSSN